MTPLFLATCYLWRNPARTIILLFCFTLLWVVPTYSRALFSIAENRLDDRIDSTPYVIGARGSRIELAIFGTFLHNPPEHPIRQEVHDELKTLRYGSTFPLLAHPSQEGPLILGTSPEYLRWRELSPREGRLFLQLGECVVGARAARQHDLRVGDFIRTHASESLSLDSPYPIELEIVGILQETNRPEDSVVLTAIQTVWIANGIGHGHQEAASLPSETILKIDNEGSVVANAALPEYTRIGPENIDSFHFHGYPADFPLHAVVFVPRDEKSETLLLGRFLQPGLDTILVNPDETLEVLIETLSRTQALVDIIFLGSLLLSGLLLLLVVWLTIKLRSDEIEILSALGCPKALIALTQLFEYGLLLLLSIVFQMVTFPFVLPMIERLVEILLLEFLI